MGTAGMFERERWVIVCVFGMTLASEFNMIPRSWVDLLSLQYFRCWHDPLDDHS
jgi:hypothetical protein